MKKIFMMMATAIILASCSQTELEETFVGQKEIKFSNLNDKVNSRAANDADANYKIYAAWSSGSNWFINDEVGGTSNLPVNGPYHWPATGTVDFYSWAPATVTATLDTYQTLSIDYTVPAAANEDFTIAAPQTGLSSGTVDLVFAHMLSKISVKATLSQDLLDAGYVLNTTGLKAKLDVQSTGGTVNPISTPAAWASPNATTASYSGAASYMIMPQSSIGCAVQVTEGILITKNGTEIYNGDLSQYTIVAGNVPAVGTVPVDMFGMGKHYMLNLTISDTSTGGGGNIFNIITFSTDVANWDTVGGTDTPLTQP